MISDLSGMFLPLPNGNREDRARLSTVLKSFIDEAQRETTYLYYLRNDDSVASSQKGKKKNKEEKVCIGRMTIWNMLGSSYQEARSDVYCREVERSVSMTKTKIV